MLNEEVEGLLGRFSEPTTSLARALISRVSAQGCDLYVKTIYVGVTVEGEMVAALYPRSGGVEVALALPDDHECELLKDASHLTWPTLPVCLDVKDREEANRAVLLIDEAYERVANGMHGVSRPPEFFRDRKVRSSGASRGMHASDDNGGSSDA